MCRNPYMKEGAAFGCGQCLPCRVNRRRIWAHRIMLECLKWKENSFVTLTYAPENVRVLGDAASGITTLSPRDVQNFLKRLRWNLRPALIRYFLVGEYGDLSWRPHYHLALFGYAGCFYGDSRLSVSQPCRCVSCVMVGESWRLGMVHQGVVEAASANYIAGYCVKRMTAADDVRLCGRYPEFARMSLRPGIGAGAMLDVAETYKTYGLDFAKDVVGALRHGKRLLPLGRYLRRRLRVNLGMSADAPEVTLEEIKAVLQPLREIAESVSDASVYVKGTYSNAILKDLIIESSEGKYRQLVAREALYKRGKK